MEEYNSRILKAKQAKYGTTLDLTIHIPRINMPSIRNYHTSSPTGTSYNNKRIPSLQENLC